jgi:hypothetical protein
MTTPIETYLSKIESDFRGGKATEYTYRSSLEILLEASGTGVEATNDPKHVACGAPDFIVERRKVPLGYVETKDLGVDLDKVEKSDQMKRYLKALNNLILTDYLEFRWYVYGERKLKVRLAEVGKNSRLVVGTGAADIISQLLSDFYDTEAPTVGTPKELAERLAGVTHFIRDQIIAALESGDPELQKALAQQYKTFVELLLPALTHAEFADLYAQAITYGLFAAKLSAPEGIPFAFEDAYKYLRGYPFLRRLFMDVNEQLDEIDIIRPYLKDLVSLLNRADFHSILKDFGRRIRTEDPVVHFYETFLATYDPKLRESRGVYYTPEPVVQFIVNSVDELLKTHFGKAWGLADESVKVLDPATGTGTFLYYVIRKIHEEVVGKRKQSGQWKSKSKDMLKRIFGFELLIAPYVVSHLKLGLLMQTLEAPLEGHDERLHVYLTNTLEEGVTRAETLAGLGLNIAQESSDAAHVKKMDDIMVVLGNPPYSGNSANNGEWITNQVRDNYYAKDEIKEQNPKMLLDDYVKFIRFAQWRIENTGYGILAFITNHGYLDNPTFRGMRQHLMNTFNEIYVLDLHGNSKKKEVAPDGTKDENVFDIQQGVAILLALRLPTEKIPDTSQILKKPVVYHASLWGLRNDKYTTLSNCIYSDIKWSKLIPVKPFYMFKPQNYELQADYEYGWKVTDIFPVYSSGLNSLHDELVINFDKHFLEKMIDDAANQNITNNEFITKYHVVDSRDWKLSKCRELAIKKGSRNYKELLIKCLYRPFDERWIILDDDFIGYARWETTKHFLSTNSLGFATARQSLTTISCLAGNIPFGQHKIVDPYNRSYIFPIYLYITPEETKGTLFEQIKTTRKANLSERFIQEFSQKLRMTFIDDKQGNGETTFGPENIFYYAYAVFHSPTYRHRYAEFLKIDFPRLPLTSDKRLFNTLGGLGKELVELHLLKSPIVDDFLTSYPEVGNNKVEKIVFELFPRRSDERKLGNIWINNKQYFGEVPEEVWSFKIGGYQVCEKWLKDRKGRMLSSDDISHYQRVVVAIKETIRIMEEIDNVIPDWPIS